MSASVFFQGGTLILKNISDSEPLPAPFRLIKGHWRCEGYHYGPLVPWFREHHIRDTVPHWGRLKLHLQDQRQPHDYQISALEHWDSAGRRGSIVLPTGAGKTFVAI